MDVSYDSGLKIVVMWSLPKFVNYEKFHVWPKWFIWINYVSEFMRAFLSNFVKKNIAKMCKIDHGVIFEYFSQNKEI